MLRGATDKSSAQLYILNVTGVPARPVHPVLPGRPVHSRTSLSPGVEDNTHRVVSRQPSDGTIGPSVTMLTQIFNIRSLIRYALRSGAKDTDSTQSPSTVVPDELQFRPL